MAGLKYEPALTKKFTPENNILSEASYVEGYANLAKTWRAYWELFLKASRVVIVFGELASTACSSEDDVRFYADI